MEHSSAECINEKCWPLVGERRGRIWFARRWTQSVGRPVDVEFDAAAVLDREERKGDVIGFLHTHPQTTAVPSLRDLSTMRGWASCFGKPLLCVIDGIDGPAGYRFDSDVSSAERLAEVQLLKRGIVIGVDVGVATT